MNVRIGGQKQQNPISLSAKRNSHPVEQITTPSKAERKTMKPILSTTINMSSKNKSFFSSMKN